MSAKNATVKLSLQVSEEVHAKLTKMAAKTGTTKSEVLRHGLGLYDIAAEAKEEGLKLGLLKKDRTVVTEIISI